MNNECTLNLTVFDLIKHGVPLAATPSVTCIGLH